MPRSNRLSLRPLLLVVFPALLVIAGVSYYLSTADGQMFRTHPPLDPETYATSAQTLINNTYRLEGTVDNLLDWSPTKGRLIAVHTSPENRLLPVVVTKDFDSVNLQKGQKFVFLVEVRDMGFLFTKDLKQP